MEEDFERVTKFVWWREEGWSVEGKNLCRIRLVGLRGFNEGN